MDIDMDFKQCTCGHEWLVHNQRFGCDHCECPAFKDAEFNCWLEQARQLEEQRKQALASNPTDTGGCFYKPHPVLVHSGKYWRCPHGQNSFWTNSCWRCGLRHPILAFRWYWPELKKVFSHERATL